MADFGQPGPFAVDIDEGEWADDTLGNAFSTQASNKTHNLRHLRFRHYRPQDSGPHPVILHSHGLGGSRASGADWLTHWASWGIASVALQHPGTDIDTQASATSPLALRPLLRLAADPWQLAIRQHDLLFALSRIAENTPTHCKIGLSGHSYGAASALRLLGEQRGDAGQDRPSEPRLSAAMLLSPSARGGNTPLDTRFAKLTLPCLHLTGTHDDGIGPGDICARDRWLPFIHSRSSDQYLLVLNDTTHRELAGDGYADGQRGEVIRSVSTAFWRAYLLDERTAVDFLRHEAAAMLADFGKWLRR